MARQSLVVVDNFYDDPDAIRNLAASLDFRRFEGVTYPGAEARCSELDWSVVQKRLARYVLEPVDVLGPKQPAFPQGLFRLALLEDEANRPDGVHQDIQSWSGVIYLSLPQHCRGGVAFYRHRETGAYQATPEWEDAVFGARLISGLEQDTAYMRSYFQDMTHWEEVQRVEMRFNRAVLLMAQCFHASMGLFGTTAEDGRLTQHFEFYRPGD